MQPDEAEALNFTKETLSIQEWSEPQAKCIESMNSFSGLFLLIQGYPGTGKTSTIVAMASIYVTCSGHVLFTAPSHDAADAICEAIAKWNAVGKTNHIIYVRVYRQVLETKAFRRHGKIYEEFQEQECDEAPGVRSVVAHVVKWSLSNVLGRVVSVFANDPIPTAEEVEEPAVEEESDTHPQLPKSTPPASEEARVFHEGSKFKGKPNNARPPIISPEASDDTALLSMITAGFITRQHSATAH